MTDERKAFNFYRSYADIALELEDKDRLAFYDALIARQFTGVEPVLNGLAKFAYISQKHSIDKQVIGYERAKNADLSKSSPPLGSPPILPPKEGEGEVQEEVKEEVELLVYPTFEDFWITYDKRTGSKNKCNKKWDKLSQSIKEEIIDHVKYYVESTPDKKYRKNPETYLNQEAWTNEIINSDDKNLIKWN